MPDELKNTERIAGLIMKYQREEISDLENQELMAWCELSGKNRQLFEELLDPEYERVKLKRLLEIQALSERGWEKVHTVFSAEDKLPHSIAMTSTRRVPWQLYRIAASVPVIFAICTFVYKNHQPVDNTNTLHAIASYHKNDVAPGGDKAILTLADGSAVLPDSTGKGTVAQQVTKNIVKVNSDTLTNTILNEEIRKTTLNSMTTSTAGQFQVALPDGSKVWLNNASSLRYPVAFTRKDREVELKGEAYFEILHNTAMPFKEKVGEKMPVNVLGTSFNIAAYGDESLVKTTLLAGAVRVSVEAAIAWKNQLFHFEKVDVRTVMRKLAHWYDVEIVYEGCYQIFKRNQVHFNLEGQEITVSS